MILFRREIPGGYLEKAMRLAFPVAVALSDRHLMVLEAYLDESGTHRGSPVVCVAGYISSQEGWQEFEARWSALLEKYGIAFFHMADFVNKAPAFRVFSDLDRRVIFSSLAGIIKECTFGSVGNAFSMDLYDRCLTAEAKQVVGGAYGLAAHACFLSTAAMVKQYRPDGWISYVLESGANGAGEILRQYQENARNPDTQEFLRLNSLRFEDKRRFVALQAADILAYELYKNLPRQQGIIRQLYRDNLRMLRFGDMSWGFLGEELLGQFSVVLTAKARQLEEQGRKPAGRGGPRSPPRGSH